MQAALQGGAATSRPRIPCANARELLLLVHSWVVAGVASDDMSNSAAITCMIFIVTFPACEYRSNVSAVSSLGKRLLSFGRRLCLPDQESAEVRMGEYRRRAVDGDLPAPTRVWSRLLPRQEPALRSPLTELLPGQETWIWSSTDSMSSSRTGAFDKETLVDVPIFPIIQVLRVIKPIKRDRCRACSRGVHKWWPVFKQRSAIRELKR
jgi:hypothetical protein